MLQFVVDQDKKGRKKGRGTLLVWIQQARQLPIVRSGATFVQWLVSISVISWYFNYFVSISVISLLQLLT